MTQVVERLLTQHRALRTEPHYGALTVVQHVHLPAWCHGDLPWGPQFPGPASRTTKRTESEPARVENQYQPVNIVQQKNPSGGVATNEPHLGRN